MKKWVLSHLFPDGRRLYYFPYQGSFGFCQNQKNALKFETKEEAEIFLKQTKERHLHLVALHQLEVTEESPMI